MPHHARTFVAIAAAGALLAAPAAGLASHRGTPHGQGGGSQNSPRGCATTPKLAYQVSGDLVSAGAGTVTLRVTSANSHARKSGEIEDQNATRRGVQVAGAMYTVPASDPFVVSLRGYEGTDTPSPGDRVRVSGKIELTKKRCAPAGTSTADRYATPDVKRVTFFDRDADE